VEFRSRTRAAVAAVVVAGILLATLTPGKDGAPPSLCIVCGDLGVADVINNLLLFAPLGATLVAAGVRLPLALASAVLLSASVEALQISLVPGRDASLGDVLFDTVGAGIGALAWTALARLRAHPSAPAAWRLAIASAALPVLVVTATGVLVRPSWPPSDYYAQWNAQFGNMEQYRGHVVAADLAGTPLPSARLPDGAALRARVFAGAAVRIRFVAGPPPVRLAPIFSMSDGRRRRFLLVGTRGNELTFFTRLRSADLRLVQPPLVWPRALAANEGDTLSLRVRWTPRGWCLDVGTASRCPMRYGVGRGWAFLLPVPDGHRRARVLDGLWMLALFGGAGYWSRGARGAALAAGGVLAVTWLVPLAAGLQPAGRVEWAGILAGLAVGATLRHSTPDPGATPPDLRARVIAVVRPAVSPAAAAP
jgi:hypothetical protein